MAFGLGHAVAGKCLRRESSPRIYGAVMVMVTLFAALRWNGKVSDSMMRKIRLLVGKSLGFTR